jgi:hypothetical protein
MTTSGVRTASMPATARAAPARPLVPLRISFPLIAILGYAAFLITGFGTRLGPWRPIPLYVFFGFLLFVLQANLVATRSRVRLAYTAFASVFALLYAADVVFNRSPQGHFTRAPLTYVIINFLLFAVLIYDALARRQDLASDTLVSASGGKETTATPVRRRAPLLAPATLATDFAELAMLSYIAATLVNLLRVGSPPYVIIDLNQTLHLHLPARIHYLQDFDSALALAATALSLLFLGIVSGLAAGQDGAAAGTGDEPGVAAAARIQAALGRIIRTSLREVSTSLRLVLGPLIWVGSGLSIAYLALRVADYFQSSQGSSNVFDLLNPFSAPSRSQLNQGLITILLTALAILTVVLSIAIVEHDVQVIRRTVQLIVTAGQTVALTLAFFIFSLAFLNAVLVFVDITRVEPFQVSAFAIVALVAAGVLPAYAAIHSALSSPSH